MKKLTKKLGMSTLALASVFALGFSAVNTVASNNVSTQASASTMAYEGDIDSREGVTLVDNVVLPSFEIGTSSTAVTGAKLNVTATSSPEGWTAGLYSPNQLAYKIEIVMPAGFTHVSGYENAITMSAGYHNAGLVGDSSQYQLPYYTTPFTWTAATGDDLTTTAGSYTGYMQLPRVATTWDFNLYINDTTNTNWDDTSVTDGHTMENVYSFTVNTWEYDSEMIVNPEFVPYFDNATLDYQFASQEDAYDGYIEYSFDLHVNGFDWLNNESRANQTQNSDELRIGGYVYIPYIQTTATSDDTYKGYLVDFSTNDLADDNLANNSNENLVVVESTEGSETVNSNDDVYSVTVRANIGGAEMQSKSGSNTTFTLLDHTNNIGQMNYTGNKDVAGKVDDPATIAVENSTTGVQNEATGFVEGSVLFSDTWTNNTTPDIEWADNGNAGDAGDDTTNYSRYATLDQENTNFVVTANYNVLAQSETTGTTSVEHNSNVIIPSKAQFNAAQSNYNAFIAENPWGISGTNTAITAIVLASIFGVTTIGLGAYIVVNNNKAKKAKAHTSTTHSHDKK